MMKRFRTILAAAVLVLLPALAHAQSAPPFTYLFQPTTDNWISYFAGKQDYSPRLTTYGNLSSSGVMLLNSGTPSTITVGGNGTCLTVSGGVPVFGSCSGTLGAGTVTSVAVTMPGLFTTSGCTITTTGTCAVGLASVNANQVFAGPTTGVAAAPGLRSLVGADLPNPTSSTLGGVQSLTVVSHNFMTGISTSGIGSAARPACADLSDASAACTTAIGTTGATIGLLNGNNVRSGTETFAASILVPVRTVTGAGAITISATTDYMICVKKTSGAATAITLPASPATGANFVVKDCKGDAATNNITVTPASGTIDGASAFVMSTAYQSVGMTYNGSEWSLN